MKNFAIILAAAGLMLAVPHATQARVLTFEFDPNDVLDLYPTDHNQSNTTQPNARRIHETWGGNFYNTFNDYMAAGHSQPTDYNTYLNWRDGLGTDEGLGSFSIYLRGEYDSARVWGEILVTDPDKPMSATAAAGWNAEIVDSPGPDAGYVAVWWTTDPTKYIRPGGADIGTFSFTADVYEDLNENGFDASDIDAGLGLPYRIWFADTWMNAGDENVPALVYDDEGWGSLVPNDGTFAQTPEGDSGVEAILTLTGIPEPGTMTLLALGGLGVLIRRSKIRCGGKRK